MPHRFIESIAGITLLALALVSLPLPCRAADFILKAEPCEALAGGPVIVKVTLEYTGAKTVYANGLSVNRPDNIDVAAPKGWGKPPKKDDGHIAYMNSDKEFKRGDKVSHYVYLHHQYAKIPAGKATLTFSWSLSKPISDKIKNFADYTLADTVAKCEVEVLPATKQNLNALRLRILDDILGQEMTGVKTMKMANQLIRTNHPDTFVPLCFLYLALHPSSHSAQIEMDLFGYLTDCEKAAPKVRANLVDYLVNHGSRSNAGAVVGNWTAKRVRLTNQEVARLMEARNLGVQAVIAAKYPDQVTKEMRDRFYRDLEALRQSATPQDE